MWSEATKCHSNFAIDKPKREGEKRRDKDVRMRCRTSSFQHALFTLTPKNQQHIIEHLTGIIAASATIRAVPPLSLLVPRFAQSAHGWFLVPPLPHLGTWVGDTSEGDYVS